MFLVQKLATLLYPSPSISDSTRHHLLVLLTDPFGPAEQVLMACICTLVDGADDSCMLTDGDHDFIKHDSYVAYGFCRVEPAKALINGVATGVFLEKGPIDEAVYKKIMSGIKKSPFTKPFVLEFLKETEKVPKNVHKKPQPSEFNRLISHFPNRTFVFKAIALLGLRLTRLAKNILSQMFPISSIKWA